MVGHQTFDFKNYGFVVGMRDEALVLQAHGVASERIFCSGGRSGVVYAGAKALLRSGACGLASFGVAGGVAPGWSAGRIALIDSVLASSGERFVSDSSALVALVQAAERLALAADVASALGVDRALTSPVAKSAAHREFGVAVVDMESHEVARAAAALQTPFFAVRVVVDPPERVVPPPALVGLGPDGRTRPWAVIARLALAPHHLLAVMRLARDSRTAFASLERCAALFCSVGDKH
ncbi:PNP_UDP_1 domain-containing protein [Azospirillaceae bacterium]